MFTVVAAVAILAAATVLTPVPAIAVTPSVAMSISPVTGQAGVAADHVETFKANAALTNATIRTTIPSGWTSPQAAQPSLPGYVVAARGTCAGVTALPALSVQPNGSTQVTVSGITCARGASLTLGYLAASATLKGNYSFGPTSVQPSPGAAFATIGSPTVNVTAGPTTHFAVTTSAANRTAGVGFSITVTPEDAAGEVSHYSGTVAVTSTDHGTSTVLPPPTLITAAHSFTVTLTTAGVQSVTVTDTSTPSIAGTLAGITVQPAATSLLTWSAFTPVDPATPAGQFPVGAPVSYTISATDRFHNVTPSFAAKVSTTSSTDHGATLPAVYTFVPSTDHGTHTFQLTPSTVGNQTYTATDVANTAINASTTLTVGLALAPHAALTGTVGVPFTQTITAVGATGALTWSASGLPSWLTLDPSSGTLSGTPTAAGVFPAFTVTATDSASPAHSGSWTYSLMVGKGSQTITVTSAAPDAPYYHGPTYTPTGTSTSTLGVVFTIDPSTSAVCSIDNTGVVSFIATGTCTVNADQPGDDNFLAAPQVQQSFTVAGATQSITFTSSAPTDAVVNGATYTPTGTASSTLGVAFTIDSPATAPCTISGGVVSFTAIGVCVVDANQAGDGNWLAAPQVQQFITVGGEAQSIQFTSTAPADAKVGGATYTPTATATSNLPVTLTIDSPATAPCTMAGDGTVSVTATGTCTIDANQPGDGTTYAPAGQVQQMITVAAAAITAPLAPIIGIHVNFPVDPQVPVIPPADVSHCPSQDPDNGGCAINELDGTINNLFDASSTIDPNPNPSQDTVSYHWQIFYPSIFGSQVLYSSDGISGYRSPELAIVPGSIPQLDGDPRVGSDIFWRVELTVTTVGPTGLSSATTAYFRFAYASDFSLEISSACQLTGMFMGVPCGLIAPQLLPVGDQGPYVGSTAPTNAVVGGPAYTPTTGSYSGYPVTLSIDTSSNGACVLNSDGTVSFAHVGMCVVDASTPAQGVWSASASHQSFTVGQGTPTITFGALSPGTATVAGATYQPTATSNSDQTVTVAVDPASAQVCVISANTGYVNYIAPGTCTIDATVIADVDWKAATATQTIAVSWPQLQTTVNAVVDPQNVPYPPNTNNCDPQTPAAGGCFIDPLDGTAVNILDASATIAPTTDPGFDPTLFTLAFHWQIYKPPGLGSALYSSNGITGYHSDVLTIQPDSLPELIGTGAGQYVFWTTQLTVTINGHTTVGFFKYQYTSSTLTLKLSTTCQVAGQTQTLQCQLSAANGLPATEPT